ncbi:hypothetical protein ABFX02_14G200700 [Erythranthe guttata]
MMSVRTSQKPRLSESAHSGILDERILVLVFASLRWDIHDLCRAASVNRRTRALAKRVLWRELCAHHAPRMVSALTAGSGNNRLVGGWHALAKLLFFCGGCKPSRHFKLQSHHDHQPSSRPGHHFVRCSRFSKTSGRSFLAKGCREDVLYVSDPCEHAAAAAGERQDDLLGIYRGIFGGFMKSRTRDCLIRRRVEFEAGVRCPYCGARVWSMTAAGMIPRRNAARRLGSSGESVEYFVCLNGHLHGTCWLIPLSSSDEEEDDDEFDLDGYNNGGVPTLNNHSTTNNGGVGVNTRIALIKV